MLTLTFSPGTLSRDPRAEAAERLLLDQPWDRDDGSGVVAYSPWTLSSRVSEPVSLNRLTELSSLAS